VTSVAGILVADIRRSAAKLWASEIKLSGYTTAGGVNGEEPRRFSKQLRKEEDKKGKEQKPKE
jgi:hypothetical protein